MVQGIGVGIDQTEYITLICFCLSYIILIYIIAIGQLLDIYNVYRKNIYLIMINNDIYIYIYIYIYISLLMNKNFFQLY